MPANIDPIATRLWDIKWITGIVTANTGLNIAAGTSYLLFTADATNGGYVERIKILPNPSQNTVATVARIWINNGSTTGTAANSSLYAEIAIAATTASQIAAQVENEVLLNFGLDAGYKIYVTIGTAPGGTGEFSACVIGGKY